MPTYDPALAPYLRREIVRDKRGKSTGVAMVTVDVAALAEDLGTSENDARRTFCLP
jgi:hypothetical protein